MSLPGNPPVDTRGALELRGRTLAWGTRTLLMGIVNVTPDSFSGDGIAQPEAAIEHAVHQHTASSDILDIGGESTRPGHEPVSEQTELDRILPVIAGVRARLPDAILSVDTYKPAVFCAAHGAGADMLNSVHGLPDALLAAAAERRVPVVIMHNKQEARYDGDVMDEVLAFLEEAAGRALRAGLQREAIVLDPGIGFGKTAEHNVRVLSQVHRLCALGFPTLLGASRKSTLGALTGRGVHERAFGTAAITALAVQAGVDIVRVHDVEESRDVVSVADAIVRGWRPFGWT